MKEKETVKLIKTNNRSGSLTTRTSQACDRCRIKKVKCDGKIPSCTNCLNIGYHCQTSDKLTRRSFPKCYTESLEKNLMNLQNDNAKLMNEIEFLKKQTNSIQNFGINNDIHIDDDLITNNFFKYDNFLLGDCYIGLNTLEKKFQSLLLNHKISFDGNLQLEFDLIELNSNSIIQIINCKIFYKFPKKSQLDLIISKHFENLNSFIPILDEDLFFELYTLIFEKIDNKTENLFKLIDDEIDFIILLILIIQLNTSLFNIYDIYKLLNLTNFQFKNSINNFQNLLLSLQLFMNLEKGGKNFIKFQINLSNLTIMKIFDLGLHLNFNNLIQINENYDSKNINIYNIRLKLYWSAFTLNSLSNIMFGLSNQFSSIFNKFHIPKISSLINSSNENSDLKFFTKLVELMEKFNDLNLLLENLSSYQQFLNEMEQNMGLNDDFLQRFENSSMKKNVQINDLKSLQFYIMITSLKLLLDKTSESSISFLRQLKILNDLSPILNPINHQSSQFTNVPINFSKLSLIAILNTLLQEPLNDKKHLIVITLRILRQRYFEDYYSNDTIINFIKQKCFITNEEITNENISNKILSSSPSSSVSSVKSSITSNSSTGLFSHLNRYNMMNRNRSISSCHSSISSSSSVSTSNNSILENDLVNGFKLDDFDSSSLFNTGNIKIQQGIDRRKQLDSNQSLFNHFDKLNYRFTDAQQ
ncbi:hypothetical protein WICMUC_001161 [Wickerhamomyces mucosus]|uniref:Zn(2)-C6 fungal-type domain-containing protein n=1 Tax=Wickerhamomyces mucosus TaxID=1378264 RepID=A0A9P8PX06_9ASCO|nr:hypothetical protein WICMUC_001161 [Wickerhamomyces mucosus]